MIIGDTITQTQTQTHSRTTTEIHEKLHQELHRGHIPADDALANLDLAADVRMR